MCIHVVERDIFSPVKQFHLMIQSVDELNQTTRLVNNTIQEKLKTQNLLKRYLKQMSYLHIPYAVPDIWHSCSFYHNHHRYSRHLYYSHTVDGHGYVGDSLFYNHTTEKAQQIPFNITIHKQFGD